MKTEELIMARVRNQLRIHWSWLKDKDAKTVADFIDVWIKQATSREKNKRQ